MGTSRVADGFSDQMSPPVNCNTVRRVCTSGVSAILVSQPAVSDEPYQLRTVARGGGLEAAKRGSGWCTSSIVLGIKKLLGTYRS